jgi:hypothetical protein
VAGVTTRIVATAHADPTKHAHRNLVHVGAIEPEANNPREV